MPDKKDKSGAYYVIGGAKFRCSQGSLENYIVTTNRKVFIQNKPMVTTDDTIFQTPVAPFGKCNLNPNTQAGQPCEYAQGEWDEETCIDHGKMAVLDVSCMYCSKFSPKGGKITCVDHGQKSAPAASDDAGGKEEGKGDGTHTHGLDASELSFEKSLTPTFGVRQIKYGDQGSFVKKTPQKSEVKKLPEMRAQAYAFDAEITDEAGDKSELSWALSSVKNGKIDRDNVVVIQNGGSPFSVELKRGQYYIEGFGNKRTSKDDYYPIYMQKYIDFIHNKKGAAVPPFDVNATFLANVAENEITSVTGPDFEGRIVKYERDKVKYVKQQKEIVFEIKTKFPFDDRLDVMKCVVRNENDQKMPAPDFDPQSGKLKFLPTNVETKYVISLSLYKKNGDGVCHPEPISTYEYSTFCLYDKAYLSSQPSVDFIRPGKSVFFSIVLRDKDRNVGLDSAKWYVFKDGRPYDISRKAARDMSADSDETSEAQDDDGNGILANTWNSFVMRFEEEGSYKIRTEFVGLRTENDKGFAERAVLVSKNHVTGLNVSSTNGMRYAGLEYKVTPIFKFGTDMDVLEDGNLTASFTGIQEYRMTDPLSFCMDKAGTHKISVRLGDTAKYEMPIDVVAAKAEVWEFCNKKKEKITQIGRSGVFGIHLLVPAWASSGQTRQLRITLYEYDVRGARTKKILGKPISATVDGRGEVFVEDVKVDSKDLDGIADNGHVVYFVVGNSPLEKIDGACRSGQGGGILMPRLLLRVTKKIDVNGFFADQEGSSLIHIVKYGDPANARLRLTNVGDGLLKDLRFRLYENKRGWDSMVYECTLPKPDDDGDVILEIPTDDGDLSESGHEGSDEIPRLFYFRVEKKSFFCNDVLFTYPSAPGDLYDFNIQRNQKQLEKEVEEKKKQDSYDSPILSQTRSYIHQLKLAKKVEDSTYHKTYSTLAPVIVGKEKKSEIEKEEESRIKCPRCHENAEKMKSRLESIFPKASDADRKKVADSYSHYMRRMHMDTCWVKSHFFAQLSVESGMTLVPKSENLGYDRTSLENTYPSKIFQRKKNTKGSPWISATDAKGNRIYRDESVKKQLDEIYKKTGEEKKKAIANFVYAGTNGNGDFASGDGWKYRGGAYVQITGRDNYQKVQMFLNVFYDKTVDIMKNGADSFENDIELSVVASMCYVMGKYGNQYGLCNGNGEDGDVEAYCKKVMGFNVQCRDEKNVLTTSYDLKKRRFRELMKPNFLLGDCEWEETQSSGFWTDPIKNPQLTIWSQNGNEKPENSVFCSSPRSHQGVDLFAEEGTMLYACLDGSVETVAHYKKEGDADEEDKNQYVIIKVTDKKALEVFRGRRREYKTVYVGEKAEGSGFDKDSDAIYCVYYHMRTVLVDKGKTVHSGQPIGTSGRSGVKYPATTGTKGPHLHFEIKSKNSFKDGLKNRCNPAFYVYYKQMDEQSEEEKEIQKERKDRGLVPYQRKTKF
ncbi:MAG: DUF4280 domain-containing protein [Prevotellaceae bacterium]|nr:DUF4280 domain-containing protein [Prevotellaceae bacterium]